MPVERQPPAWATSPRTRRTLWDTRRDSWWLGYYEARNVVYFRTRGDLRWPPFPACAAIGLLDFVDGAWYFLEVVCQRQLGP